LACGEERDGGVPYQYQIARSDHTLVIGLSVFSHSDSSFDFAVSLDFFQSLNQTARLAWLFSRGCFVLTGVEGGENA
jgi:hypothetical protein